MDQRALPSHPVETPVATRRRLDTLAAEASGLGFEIVDVAGFLDGVTEISVRQLERLEQARRAAADVSDSNDEVSRLILKIETATRAALTDVERSVDVIRDGTSRTTDVAEWVGGVARRLRDVDETLKAVRASNAEISAIAAQVNILAINAKIEATRAGDAGHGFSVVAEAIKELSRKTGRAAEGIASAVERLTSWCGGLSDEAETVRSDADRLLRGTSDTNAALADITCALTETRTECAGVSEAALRSRAAIDGFRPAFDGIAAAIEATASGVSQARDRADAMIDRSERIVQATVMQGGTSDDAPFIARVRADAAEIARRLGAAVAEGRIAMADLFAGRYDPIEGTDPQQFLAPFTPLADILFPPVQEAALAMDDRVVFCAAVDRNGYLPTHNRKFSARQGADPVWNAANCRNRRIFDDRVGLKAGQSVEPFLLQVYRRDMGGGDFRMMKDLSAPITVKGRHWGGLRLAYHF